MCALAVGAPTNAARDLAFLPAHLLYRAIHKCILSSLLPFPLSLFLSCPPSPVVSARQRMHRGLFFVLLSTPPPLSSFLFSFHVLRISRLFSQPAPRALLISLSFSLPPSLPLCPSLPPSDHPFAVPSLLTVSLRRVLKSVVKPGYETGQSAGPRNYTLVCPCVGACVCPCLPYTRRYKCVS